MKNEGYNYLADAVAIIMTAVQTDRIFQYISLGLTILATALSVLLSLVKLIKWWKDAKKDGKITKEELDEAESIIKDGIDSIKEKKEGGKK